MANTDRQHPEHQKRTFHGESTSSVIVEFLNEQEDSPNKKRIRVLLELLRQLANHSDSYFPQFFTAKDREFKKLVEVFNRSVVRYKMHPALSAARGPAAALGGPEATDWRFAETPEAKTYKAHEECHAARSLIRLAELRLLDSLAQCKLCSRWLFARFSHKHFCSKECRIKYNTSTEEGKAYKRRKAREYYKAYRDGIVKQRPLSDERKQRSQKKGGR